MKRIKDWFREGMNVAGEKSAQVKGMQIQRTKIRTYTEFDLFTATVSEESHRAFLLNSQLFTILRLEDQEEALTSKQGKPSADTQYPLSQILAVVGAGRSTFAFMISSQYSYYK